MQRLLILVTLALALALALAGCGTDEDLDDVSAVEGETTADADFEPEPTPEPTDPEPTDPEPTEPAEAEPEPTEPAEAEPAEEEAEDGDEALALGETGVVGDYEVTVTGFVADATDEILDFNPFNDPPGNGVYATVTFDAAYLGEGEGNPGIDLVGRLVVDGVQHADYECLAVVENDALVGGPTLEQGGQASDLAFCFDHPGVDDDTRLFMAETFSLEEDRVYWAVLD